MLALDHSEKICRQEIVVRRSTVEAAAAGALKHSGKRMKSRILLSLALVAMFTLKPAPPRAPWRTNLSHPLARRCRPSVP